jgi:hypothetical protein
LSIAPFDLLLWLLVDGVEHGWLQSYAQAQQTRGALQKAFDSSLSRVSDGANSCFKLALESDDRHFSNSSRALLSTKFRQFCQIEKIEFAGGIQMIVELRVAVRSTQSAQIPASHSFV